MIAKKDIIWHAKHIIQSMRNSAIVIRSYKGFLSNCVNLIAGLWKHAILPDPSVMDYLENGGILKDGQYI